VTPSPSLDGGVYMLPTLETERLRIRSLEPGDLEACHRTCRGNETGPASGEGRGARLEATAGE
jgi:hypothetical protein